MRASPFLASLLLGIAAAGAQTNQASAPAPAVPAPIKIPTSSPLPPILDVAPVSASLKTSPQSSMTPFTTKKLPILIPADSEVIRTKSGTEYRGLLARSPRPAGGKFNPLQLINPFAPMSYGTAGSSSVSTPRAFRDERTHEPTGITIISVNR
ncbi:MAG: hypothetical protein H7X97_07635 [Opitutaceae bacterium]|nr:hypothetical protein [Verrucomicrobiales bacterium]